METMRSALCIVSVAVCGFIIGYCFGVANRADSTKVQYLSDTLVVHDTIRYDRPKETITKTIRDTMLIPVPVTDTVHHRDTVFVMTERQVREYSGKDYRCEVSGYDPRLDWFEVFPTTKVITNTPIPGRKKRWGIGINAGYGAAVFDGKVRMSPYIGVGISYDLFSF